ncbi:MFS domain-containing protein [Meloidogyne graminicola]|uniref:MFS domain-containing protein n=1 Tax=Meloidogyne graminicola TaxID=189291 RepID=A0A8S9ZI01_9BILA|nr:MFS domain-containing protein [Meloidogyne graminicola]
MLRLAELIKERNAEREFLFVISIICTLGGFLFGYSTGVTNGASSFIQTDLHLLLTDVGYITGSLLIGAAFGALLGGHLADKFGRRAVTFGNSFLFVFGTLGSSLAPNLLLIIFARILLGIAVGSASASVPIFLAELAPSEKRGQMVSINEFMIVFGQFIAFLSNAILGNIWADNPQIWRWMLMLGIIPSLILLFGTWLIIPESPRWLISKSKNKKALEILKQIRENEIQAINELEQIEELVENDKKLNEEKMSIITIFLNEKWLYNCLLIGIGIALCQQSTGVNSIMFYGTEILRETGFSNQIALIANIFNGLISVLAALISIWLLGKISRRRMCICAQFGVIIVHLLIGLSELFLQNGTLKGFLVLLLCVGSISPITWLLLAEIFPLKIRGLAISICTFLLWILNALIGIFFPIFSINFGIGQTFILFSILNIFAIIFSFLYLPETKGKSLEELEQQFISQDWKLIRRLGKK